MSTQSDEYLAGSPGRAVPVSDYSNATSTIFGSTKTRLEAINKFAIAGRSGSSMFVPRNPMTIPTMSRAIKCAQNMTTVRCQRMEHMCRDDRFRHCRPRIAAVFLPLHDIHPNREAALTAISSMGHSLNSSGAAAQEIAHRRPQEMLSWHIGQECIFKRRG